MARVSTLWRGPRLPLLDYMRIIPLEIFLIIRGFISSSDLRTHVCFYQCSPQIAALYDSERDADFFWELACWNCGIGVTSIDTQANICWRDIAIDCIERDGFCTIPGCGEELLEANRECMITAMEAVELDPLEVYSDGIPQNVVLQMHPVLERVSFKPERKNGCTVLYDARLRVVGTGIHHEGIVEDADGDGRRTMQVNLRGSEDEEISEGSGGSSDCDSADDQEYEDEEGAQANADEDEDEDNPEPVAEESADGGLEGTEVDQELAECEVEEDTEFDKLQQGHGADCEGFDGSENLDTNLDAASDYPPFVQHPIAYRSFATSIPVQRLGLLTIGGHLLRRFAIRSDTIVTVLDVISAIHYEPSSLPLTSLDLILDAKESKTYIEEHIYCLRHLTTEESFERLTHLRGILSQCPITTFTHIRDEAGYGSLFTVQLELSRDPFLVWMEGLRRRFVG